MINIHEENHLEIECLKISKSSLNMSIFSTLEEFNEHVETGCYCDHDCDAYWACIGPDGIKYVGQSVDYIKHYDNDTISIEYIKRPKWASHIVWSSK